MRYILQNQFLVTIIVVAIGWFILTMRDILIALFVSYILMAALSPSVEFLRRKGLPKALAVIIPYFATLAFLVLLIIPLIPFLASQVQSLFVRFPVYLNQAADLFGFDLNPVQINAFISSEFNSISRNAFDFTRRVFGGLFSALTILVVSFYLLIYHVRIRQNVVELFPRNSQEKVRLVLAQIEEKLGAWLRGQIVLSVSIGVLTYFALTILGLEFALPLALIAGMLEIVPTIGPIISAIPAVIVALSISPTMTLITIATYIVIQVLENNILVPKIMQKAVGLNPIIIILSIIIGNELIGVLGALLSIPFVSMLVILFNSLRIERG